MASLNTARIETLGKDNYDTWRIQAEALLIKNDYWSYVKCTKKRPEAAQGSTATEINTWRGRKSKILFDSNDKSIGVKADQRL